MSCFEDSDFRLASFCGKARLFPLPDFVLFPHVLQPLHIFEPRYRQMLADALADDRLIAMATLAPGWQTRYHRRPAIYPFACLGRVESYRCLPDGTYNVLLLGLCRAIIVREIRARRMYRCARVEICPDIYPAEKGGQYMSLHSRLRTAFRRLLPAIPEAQEQVDQLLSPDIPLGALTDVIGYMLEIGTAEKQLLLGEANVVRRAELVLAHVLSAVEKGKCLLAREKAISAFGLN